MTPRHAIFPFGFALLGLLACDDRTPSVPTPTPTLPPVTAVAISGLPTSLTVGQAVQLQASVTLPDGSRLDATSEVAWQSSDASVARVSTAGLLTVAGAGEAEITVTLQNVRGTTHVSV